MWTGCNRHRVVTPLKSKVYLPCKDSKKLHGHLTVVVKRLTWYRNETSQSSYTIESTVQSPYRHRTTEQAHVAKTSKNGDVKLDTMPYSRMATATCKTMMVMFSGIALQHERQATINVLKKVFRCFTESDTKRTISTIFYCITSECFIQSINLFNIASVFIHALEPYVLYKDIATGTVHRINT